MKKVKVIVSIFLYCLMIADLEGKLSRVFVKPAAVEEREDVSDGRRPDHALAGDGALAAVGQRRRDHSQRLAIHLH